MIVFTTPTLVVSQTTAVYTHTLTTGAAAENIALITSGIAPGMFRDAESIAVDLPPVNTGPRFFITPTQLGLASLSAGRGANRRPQVR